MLVIGLNQTRDMSLNTRIVTHQSSKGMQGNNSSTPSLYYFLLFFFLLSFFFLFFSRAETPLFSIQNNQNKGITAHNSIKIRSTFWVSSSRSQISYVIAKCSKWISGNGWIHCNDYKINFPDCVETLDSDIKHKIWNCFLPVLNLGKVDSWW